MLLDVHESDLMSIWRFLIAIKICFFLDFLSIFEEFGKLINLYLHNNTGKTAHKDA